MAMNDRNTVAEASVRLSADQTQLKTDLNSAKTEVRNFANSAQGDVDRAGDSIAKSANKAVGGFRQMLGTVTGAIGVFTAFFTAGKRVAESLETASEKADKLSQSLNFTDPVARVRELETVMDGLSVTLTRLADNEFIQRILSTDQAFLALLKGQGLQQALNEQLEEFERRAESARNQAIAKELNARREMARKFAEELEKEIQKAFEKAIDKAAASRRNAFNSEGLLEASTDSFLANVQGLNNP